MAADAKCEERDRGRSRRGRRLTDTVSICASPACFVLQVVVMRCSRLVLIYSQSWRIRHFTTGPRSKIHCDLITRQHVFLYGHLTSCRILENRDHGSRNKVVTNGRTSTDGHANKTYAIGRAPILVVRSRVHAGRNDKDIQVANHSKRMTSAREQPGPLQAGEWLCIV